MKDSCEDKNWILFSCLMMAGSHRGQCSPNGDAGRSLWADKQTWFQRFFGFKDGAFWGPLFCLVVWTHIHFHRSDHLPSWTRVLRRTWATWKPLLAWQAQPSCFPALLAGCDCSKTTKAFSNVSTFWRAVPAHPTTISETRLQPDFLQFRLHDHIPVQLTVSIRSWGLLNPHMDTNGYPVPGSNDEPTQISDNTCCASIFLGFKGLLRKWALWLRCQVRQDSIWIRKH